jgi:hypothetical protein
MGGHGGLNILPQKKWNVYNWDNRIKVMENEKVVQKEVDKLERKKKDKGLHDLVRHIKNPDGSNFLNTKQSSEIDDKEKNKIFKEVMSRKSMGEKLKVDLFFEKMNTTMKSDEQLKLFDNDLDVNKLINPDQDEAKLTLKDSIKNHLNPWWMKKNPADFEFYRDINSLKVGNKKVEEDKDRLLNKKHKRDKKDKKKEKKHTKDKEGGNGKKDSQEKQINLDKLRKERIEREMREKERINNFMSKNNINYN